MKMNFRDSFAKLHEVMPTPYKRKIRVRKKRLCKNILYSSQGSDPRNPTTSHHMYSDGYMRNMKKRNLEHIEAVKHELCQLQMMMKVEPSKERAFKLWCRHHAQALYPDLGKVAYAIPPFHLNKDSTRPSRIPGALESRLQESEARGDQAQRKVSCAFRLLNNAFERKSSDTMFIMEDLLYENILIWLINAPLELGAQFIKENCADVCMPRLMKNRYFRVPLDSGTQRHEASIIVIHKTKGIIFVQITAILEPSHRGCIICFGEYRLQGTDSHLSTFTDSVKSVSCHWGIDNEKTKEKINKAINQLETDSKIFNCIMQQNCSHIITKVVAVPNIERDNLKFFNTEHDVIFLCHQDLFHDTIAHAESETDLRTFQKWWELLPDKSLDDCIEVEDIIARYVGIFSTPLKFNEGNERSHVRNMCDFILWTANRFSRLVITKIQGELLMDHRLRHVCLVGPPGSGKTVMLILKARLFLQEDTDNHVIVVNLRQHSHVDIVGKVIVDKIKEADIMKFEKRVSSVDIDAISEDTRFISKLFHLKNRVEVSLRNVMFVINSAHASPGWHQVFSPFFKDSVIWCASISDQNIELTDFEMVFLNIVYRCPPAVQRILYHVDPDEKRKMFYTSDTVHTEVPTNGPTVLCIRHNSHDHDVAVIHCPLCARELVYLLQNKLQVFDRSFSSSAMGATLDTSSSLSCSVVILISTPERNMTSHCSEVQKKSFTDVTKAIYDNTFIHTLEKYVKITTDPDILLNISEDYCHRMLITDVDSFQEIKSDVVVFLPSYKPVPFIEHPFSDPLLIPEHAIISAIHADFEKQSDKITEPMEVQEKYNFAFSKTKEFACSQLETLENIDSDTVFRDITENSEETLKLNQSGEKTLHEMHSPTVFQTLPHSSKSSSREEASTVSKQALATVNWHSDDIKRYSKWDQINLFHAASRCLSQLILMIP